MNRISDLESWKSFLRQGDYVDPIVIAVPRKIRYNGVEKIPSPAHSQEVFDDARYRWFLTSREDAVVFKLLNVAEIGIMMEVSDFIEVMTSYSASKELYTGLDFYMKCTTKHE